MTLLSLDNGNDTELNITIRSFKIRFKSTFLQERPSLAFIVEHELPPEMRLREYVLVKLDPKLTFAQPPLDRSQPLFYFVPREILTIKLARLASSVLQVMVFGLQTLI